MNIDLEELKDLAQMAKGFTVPEPYDEDRGYGMEEILWLMFAKSADPATVLALIERLERAEAALAGMKAAERANAAKKRDINIEVLVALMSEYLDTLDNQENVELWDTEQAIASGELNGFVQFAIEKLGLDTAGNYVVMSSQERQQAARRLSKEPAPWARDR
jgi:phosphoglycolate phosphatase-like HAD superfamily hydrolase